MKKTILTTVLFLSTFTVLLAADKKSAKDKVSKEDWKKLALLFKKESCTKTATHIAYVKEEDNTVTTVSVSVTATMEGDSMAEACAMAGIVAETKCHTETAKVGSMLLVD